MLAIGDVVWQAAIPAGLAFGLAWIGYKVQSISKSNNAVCALVNATTPTQLRLLADLCRWRADQTKLQKDIDAAYLAEKLLHEYEAKKAVANGVNGK